jgi:hypothetical protein
MEAPGAPLVRRLLAVGEPSAGEVLVEVAGCGLCHTDLSFLYGGVRTRKDPPLIVFACGPWLPKLFPDLLDERIFPTRQEVFCFGPPAGDASARPRCRSGWTSPRRSTACRTSRDGASRSPRIDTGRRSTPMPPSVRSRTRRWPACATSWRGVAARIAEGGPVETRFSLATKDRIQKRSVY